MATTKFNIDEIQKNKTSDDYKSLINSFKTRMNQGITQVNGTTLSETEKTLDIADNWTARTNAINSINKISNNTIQTVNDFLDTLIANGLSQDVQNALKADIAKAGETRKNSVKPISKSYNVRAPYIELFVGGKQIYPKRYNPDNPEDSPETRDFFQALELSAAFGGVSETVTGTLTLFSKNPFQLLSELFTDDKTDSGFSKLRLRYGWSIAFDNKTDFLLTPWLDFIIMNVSMTDPGGAQGADFTIQLQDEGSAVLQNSSGDVVIEPNFYQEQIRFILEGCLGLRLFTLDDFLYFHSSENDSPKQTMTFFTSQQNSYLRVNSNTFWNVIDDLLGNVRCRWYPTDNDRLSQTTTESQEAIQKLFDLQKKLKQAQEDKKEEKEITDLINQIVVQKLKLSNKCKLIWVPYFPKEILSTSGTFYNDSYEDGAFLLLPELAATEGLKDEEMPLIYGPGGSAAPYLHGSAMNLLQKALENSSIPSETFGDVQSLSVNIDNLLLLMKLNSGESAEYRVEGDRLTAFQTVNDALIKATIEGTKQKLEKNKKDTKARFRFKGTVAPRTMIIGDNLELLKQLDNGKTGKDNPAIVARSSYNPEKVEQTAQIYLKNRLLTFLNYPLNITMSVLGDPLLIRQGIGSFELLSYFPSEDDGKTQQLNTITSGVYMPQQITHRLTIADYTTEIQALKINFDLQDEANSSSSLISTIKQNITDFADSKNAQLKTALQNNILNINLDNAFITNSQNSNFSGELLINTPVKIPVIDPKTNKQTGESINFIQNNSSTLGSLIAKFADSDLENFVDSSNTSLSQIKITK